MKRRATANDLRMLTDVRDRLLAALQRHETKFFANAPKSANAPFNPIDCNHGVPWTECTSCSKPRTP